MRYKLIGGRTSFHSVAAARDLNIAAIVLHNANLETEASSQHIARGPIPVAGGGINLSVAIAQREYTAVVLDGADQVSDQHNTWPINLTRTAGYAVRRAVAQHALNNYDSTHL